jgi:hypothetical protein
MATVVAFWCKKRLINTIHCDFMMQRFALFVLLRDNLSLAELGRVSNRRPDAMLGRIPTSLPNSCSLAGTCPSFSSVPRDISDRSF